MPPLQILPDFINGFKIIKDLGLITPPKWKKHTRCIIALCKKCNKEFFAVRDQLKANSKGCSKLCAGSNGGTKRLTKIFGGMMERCYNPNHISAKNYSSKNITICDEWLKDVSSFYSWSFNNGYTENLTLDRIDNSKGYHPENCRWTNKSIQSQNSINAKLNENDIPSILMLLKTKQQKEIAKIYNVSISLINGIHLGTRWKNIPRNF